MSLVDAVRIRQLRYRSVWAMLDIFSSFHPDSATGWPGLCLVHLMTILLRKKLDAYQLWNSGKEEWGRRRWLHRMILVAKSTGDSHLNGNGLGDTQWWGKQA